MPSFEERQAEIDRLAKKLALDREAYACKGKQDAIDALVAMGWRPQAEAPRDGTVFLSWRYATYKLPSDFAITWSGPGDSWHKADSTDSSYGGYCNLVSDCFDLWLPLHAPVDVVGKGKA